MYQNMALSIYSNIKKVPQIKLQGITTRFESFILKMLGWYTHTMALPYHQRFRENQLKLQGITSRIGLSFFLP